MTESELIDYNDTITDFSCLIQNYGPYNVAKDFQTHYPKQCDMLIKAAAETIRGVQVARLFQPREKP